MSTLRLKCTLVVGRSKSSEWWYIEEASDTRRPEWVQIPERASCMPSAKAFQIFSLWAAQLDPKAYMLELVP